MARAKLALALAVASALFLTGCSPSASDDPADVSSAGDSGAPVFGDSEVAKLVSALPERTVKALPAASARRPCRSSRCRCHSG
jgi:hypothetical protein